MEDVLFLSLRTECQDSHRKPIWKLYADTRSMLSKQSWLDRDLHDYSGLDDDDEKENHLKVRGDQEVVSFPDVIEGERQSELTYLHGEPCRLQPYRHIQ